MKIIPAKGQIYGWAVLFFFALLSLWQTVLTLAVALLLLVWLVVLALTGWRLARAAPLVSISRVAQTAVSARKPFSMQFVVQSHAQEALSVRLFDHYPAEFTTKDMPMTLDLPAGSKGEMAYFLTPPRRGKFTFAGVQVRYPDRWLLWQKNVLLPPKWSLRVFPVFHQNIPKTGFQSVALPHFGTVHPLYARTGSGDFDHLRAYRAGDPLSRLDHKASARLNAPVSREFIFEHEQPVMFLLDASRRMGLGFDGKTLLDESLNAAFLLARVALAQGDRFGMGAFSVELGHFYHADHGTKQLKRLQERFFDLFPDDNPPNFIVAAEQFYRREQKRSLVIVLTTLQDGDGAALQRALKLLKRKHHILLVSLRPPLLDESIEVDSEESAAFVGARDDYANRFTAMQNALRKEKIWFVECRPEQLQVQLVNHYLQYKKMLSG